VVGVVVLLGVAVASLALVTAGVGTVVQHTATRADAARATAGLEDALRPVETTGVHVAAVPFADGRLRTANRSVRVLGPDGPVLDVPTDALVFDSGEQGVTAVAGAVVVRGPGRARVERGFPVTASPSVLVLGVARVEGRMDVASNGAGTGVRLRTNVSHRRRDLGPGRYRLAVETRSASALARYYRDRRTRDGWNVTVAVRDFDGDGIPSVVLGFPTARHAYLVTHRVEVSVA